MSNTITLSASLVKLNAKFCASNDALHDARITRAQVAAELVNAFPKAPTKALSLWNALVQNACEANGVRCSMSAAGRIGIPNCNEEERADADYMKRRNRLADAYTNVLRDALKSAGITLAGARERDAKPIAAAETDVLARDAKLLAKHLKAGEYTRKQLLAMVTKLVSKE